MLLQERDSDIKKLKDSNAVAAQDKTEISRALAEKEKLVINGDETLRKTQDQKRQIETEKQKLEIEKLQIEESKKKVEEERENIRKDLLASQKNISELTLMDVLL